MENISENHLHKKSYAPEPLLHTFIKFTDCKGRIHECKMRSASIAVNAEDSCGLLAVEFILIFFHDKSVDEQAPFSSEGELVLVFKLLDDETSDHFFRKGGMGEELGVLGDALVDMDFEGGEGIAEFALVRGGIAVFHESLVEASVFGVVGVFGEEELIFPL